MPSSKLKQFGLVMTGVVAGVMISLNFSANADKTALAPLPVEELRAFADVFNAIKQGYVEPVDDKKLVTHAISGMLSGLDPHSAYLDAEAFKDLQVGTQGEFGGLGIEVGMEDGFVKVVSPIEDTPAFRAGVKAGDLIVKLDDTPVKGMSLNDAVKRMRGKPKTDITLTIMRKGEVRPVIVTLTREVIKVQSVKSKVVEPGYGYPPAEAGQGWRTQGAGARSAQRSGRPAARCGRCGGGLPASQYPGGVDRWTYRGRQA